MLFKSSPALLNFSVLFVLIFEEFLKFTQIVNLSSSPYSFIRFCSMYFKLLLLGSLKYGIVFFLTYWSFYHYEITVFLVVFFAVKST